MDFFLVTLGTRSPSPIPFFSCLRFYGSCTLFVWGRGGDVQDLAGVIISFLLVARGTFIRESSEQFIIVACAPLPLPFNFFLFGHDGKLLTRTYAVYDFFGGSGFEQRQQRTTTTTTTTTSYFTHQTKLFSRSTLAQPAYFQSSHPRCGIHAYLLSINSNSD